MFLLFVVCFCIGVAGLLEGHFPLAFFKYPLDAGIADPNVPKALNVFSTFITPPTK